MDVNTMYLCLQEYMWV